MARGKIQGWVEQGGHTVLTDGRLSTDKVQQSFPLANVEVFNAGTLVQATIFSDEAGTPKANPFVADSTGFWFFWADQARYDVKFSGAGITTPFTIFSLETIIAAGLVDPGSNGILARTAPNVLAARTILGTTSEIVVTNGDGSGNPTISLSTGLNFSGKTVSGGTFLSPGIANFTNAQHTHEDAIGGGQLNATNVFNAGTVPVARLPILVGATGGTPGVAGLAPAPAAGEQNNFLRGDGTWQVTGGGGGTPGSPSLSLQYNNAGAFGGITTASSEGTNVTITSGGFRATRPRITTSIDDVNGNEVIALVSVGSAVNEVSIASAGTGTGPSITVTGGDANPNLNISAKGSGIIATVSNIQISNNAPQIVLVDVNDSKTVRMSLSGANWGFINDTLGSTPLLINTTNNLITTAGDVTVGGSLNILTGQDIHNIFFGADFRIDADDTLNTWRFIATPAATVALQISATTGGVTFAVIPEGPAANPTTDNQLARKKYTDEKSTWSKTWFYPVLPGAVETIESVGRYIIPPNGKTITSITAVWASGSDSGASNIFTIKRRNSAGTLQADVGTVDVNTPAQNAIQESVVSVAVSSNDQIYPLFTTRNTASETIVSITVRGT